MKQTTYANFLYQTHRFIDDTIRLIKIIPQLILSLKRYLLTLLSIIINISISILIINSVCTSIAFAQAASSSNPAGSYLGVKGQVVASSSGNVGSTDAIATGDTVQWSNYFQSKLSSPFRSVGIMSLPAGFKWVNGSVKLPPKVTLEYEVGGVFLPTEPVTGTVVTRVRWTIDPLMSIKIQPVPQNAINFQGTGDGYRVIPYQDKLFVINHHTNNQYLNCRMAANGTPCPGFEAGGKNISPILGQSAVAGIYPEFVTANRPIEHLDMASGNLFIYGGTTASEIVVLCVHLDDLSSCANKTIMSTGVISTKPESTVNPIASIGNKYYASRYFDGAILCYDTATKVPCIGSPYITRWGSMPVTPGVNDPNDGTTPSYIYNNQIYVVAGKIVTDPVNNYTSSTLKCFNASTNGPCNGWAFNSAGASSDLWVAHGSIFPYLNPNGSFKGICTAQLAWDSSWVTCRDAANNPFSPSLNYASYLPASGFMSASWDQWFWHGTFSNVSTWGTKVFQSESWYNNNYINCFDFATDSRCFSLYDADSTKQPKTYSIVIDNVRPYCMWAVGDSSLAKSFDPRTGASCPAVNVFPPAITLDVAPGAYYNCDGSKSNITAWGKVRFSPVLPWGGASITAVSAKIMDSTGTILPAAYTPNRNFTYGTYELDISDIPFNLYQKLKIELTFTANNANISADVGFDVTWVGEPIQLCFNTVAPTVNNCQIDVSVTQNNLQVHTPSAVPEVLAAAAGLVPGKTDLGYGPDVTTTTLRQYPVGSSDPTQLLQTTYNLNNFTGALNQYNLLADLSISATPVYTNGASTFGATWTSASNSSGLMTAVPFAFSNISAAQKTILNTSLNNTVDNKGTNRLSYLSGTRTDEKPPTNLTGILRSRSSIFGPSIDSSPIILMKTPLVGYSDAQFPGYSTFRKATARANTMAYYQANDGFLHAYQVSSATGLTPNFSFLPSTILDKAVRYTDATLADLRKDPYWLDNTPAIADAHLGDTTANANLWRSVLVGTQGRGGRSIYALDITSGGLDNLLFEYDNTTHTDLYDLGYIIGQPATDKVTGADQIVRLNDNRWAYITGNGINSNLGATNAGTGKAVLYLFYLNAQTSTLAKWRRIPVNSGALDPVLDYNNGLSTPRAIDIDGDGDIDLIYAGDIQGNLWRFDVRNVAAPVVTKIYKTPNGQPIYTAPVVTKVASANSLCPAAKVTSNECWLVSFGTGELYNRLEGTNPKNSTIQSLYGIYDVGDTGAAALVADTQLVTQTITNISSPTGASSRNTSSNPVVYGPTATGTRGWKINLTAAEHTSTNPVLLNATTLLFASTRPSGAVSAGCVPADGWLTKVSLDTGTSSNSVSTGISLTGALDSTPKSSRSSDSSALFLPNLTAPLPAGAAAPYCPPSKVCKAGQLEFETPSMLGRMSWREVFGLPK